MKPHYFYATTALALVVAGTTQAAGDHTQGTYICGKGLDDTDAATDTPTGTCKTVTPASGVQLPPMAGPVPSTLSVNLSDGTLVTLTGCSGQDVVYWECKGSFGAAGFCGAPINTSVPVIVVRAKLTQDASQKQFDFNAIDLTLVCGPAQSAPPLSCSLSASRGKHPAKVAFTPPQRSRRARCSSMHASVWLVATILATAKVRHGSERLSNPTRAPAPTSQHVHPPAPARDASKHPGTKRAPFASTTNAGSTAHMTVFVQRSQNFIQNTQSTNLRNISQRSLRARKTHR
jgi:hypothetical protein